MNLRITHLRLPGNQLEEAMIVRAKALVINLEDITTILDLFLALSIYKCQIQGNYRENPDRVQVNLIRMNGVTGIRIYRINQPTDTLRILNYVGKG